MIHIITDSTCELGKEEQERLGIQVVPLKVLFGTEEYLDGVDLSPEAFYHKLTEEKEVPTTTQANPSQFQEIFEAYTQEGDEVIGIFVSSKLSGTYQSAMIAKDMLEKDNIHLIDSHNVTIGLSILVIEAAKMRNEGESVATIIERLEAMKGRIRVVAAVDTLKYVHKGGRISGVAAALGTALGIKPIIEVKDGIVNLKDKVRGRKKVIQYLVEDMKKHQPSPDHVMVFGHSLAEPFLAEFLEAAKKDIDITGCYELVIGSTIGAHVGPGGIGFAFVTN